MLLLLSWDSNGTYCVLGVDLLLANSACCVPGATWPLRPALLSTSDFLLLLLLSSLVISYVLGILYVFCVTLRQESITPMYFFTADTVNPQT